MMHSKQNLARRTCPKPSWVAAALLTLALLLAVPAYAGVNVLVLGSSQHFDLKESGAGADRLDLEAMADELGRIINRGERNGPSTVVFEDIYQTKETPVALGSSGRMIPTTFYCHSLAQYYFWPEGREARLDFLRGESGLSWDYVVLAGDPYLMDRMPGVFAEGVALVAQALRANPQVQLVLLTPWLAEGEAREPLKDVSTRVGAWLELAVAPAGETVAELRAWNEDRAAYLAAACVFSALSGRPAWGRSGDARAALDTVLKLRDEPAPSEPYVRSTPFTVATMDPAKITFKHTGTSSERGIWRGIQAALRMSALNSKSGNGANAAPILVNYGRGNSNFEPKKQYQVDPEQFDRSYGFPMQESNKSARTSMRYGIDKRYFNGSNYDDGTDLGIAYDMCRAGEVAQNARAVPLRLMWAKLHELDPSLKPLRDRWHMSHLIEAAAGAYMVTALTGQDTRGPEPTDQASADWKTWQARAIGYETALRMGLRFSLIE